MMIRRGSATKTSKREARERTSGHGDSLTFQENTARQLV